MIFQGNIFRNTSSKRECFSKAYFIPKRISNYKEKTESYQVMNENLGRIERLRWLKAETKLKRSQISGAEIPKLMIGNHVVSAQSSTAHLTVVRKPKPKPNGYHRF
jgi:hypothetical protein